jgi:transposase
MTRNLEISLKMCYNPIVMNGPEQLRTYLEKFQKIENFTLPPTEPVEVWSKPKRGGGKSSPEVAAKRQKVAELWKQGKSVKEIAEILEKSSGTITAEAARLRKQGVELEKRRRKPSLEINPHRQRIAELWNQHSPSEIAEQLGVHVNTVKYHATQLKKQGINLERKRKGPKKSPKVATRRQQVAELWNQGKTDREIAELSEIPLYTVTNDLRTLRKQGIELNRRQQNLSKKKLQKEDNKSQNYGVSIKPEKT